MKKTFAYFISIIVVGGTASSGIQPSPALKGGEEDNSSSSNTNLRNSISTTDGRNLAKKKGPKKKGPFDDDEETGAACPQFCQLEFSAGVGFINIVATKTTQAINAVLPKTYTSFDGSITNVTDLIPQINETIIDAFAACGDKYEVTSSSFFSSPPELIKIRYDIEVCGPFIDQNDLIDVE